MLMRNLVLVTLVIAALPLTTNVASGQDRREERADARRGYRAYNRTPWYSNADVRRQLKLDEDQYKRLNERYVEYWTPYDKGITTIPADLAEAERQKRIAELNKTFHSGVAKSTTEVITDPQIRDRYNQLYWQYQGYGAFEDPTVQQRLKLTDEQRQAFAKQRADWEKQMNTYSSEYATDRDVVNKNFTTTWKSTRENINKTLTPEQRKVWVETIGEPYDFPADVYFEGSVEGGGKIEGTIKPTTKPAPEPRK